jgi:3-hydroxybutyryl-CoA dehydrogenase
MEIKRVCVAGGGLMGRQIALNTARYNYNVVLYDVNAEVRRDAFKWSEDYLADRIKKGKMTADEVAGIKDRLQIADSLEEAARNADLVIEAIIENEEKKREFFKQLNTVVNKNAIIATNSSYLVSSLFADCVDNPKRLLNLHYFYPALVMKLIEVIRGEHTADEAVEAMLKFSADTGKTPVLINREIEGFIVNRILRAINREALSLVEQGYCSYQDLDIACEKGLSHPMWPCKLMDFTGVDLSFHVMKAEYDKTGKKPAGYDLIEEMYAENHWGCKTGKGFYDY